MSQPVFLPGMATVSAKPNVLRSGLPLSVGSTINGNLQPGPPPDYLSVEVLINEGTRACYQFSDQYCYAGAPTQSPPTVSQSFALNLANNQQSATMGAQAMNYGTGGIQFTAGGGATPQEILFNVADAWPAGYQSDNFVSTIWLGLNAGAPLLIGAPGGATNSLLFTYPDGSTWSIVDGIYTFKPLNQVAISVNAVPYATNQPVQLGYELDLQVGAYSVILYVNGQKAFTQNYASAYVPPATWPLTFGFGPNSISVTQQFTYTAMRFYLEDLTVSGAKGYNVVSADWLVNYWDLVSQFSTSTYPTSP